MSRTSLRCWLLAMSAAALLLTLGAVPAFAGGIWWHLATSAAPTNLPAGGEGQIVVSMSNFGYEDAKASAAHPFRITDRLPPGLQAVASSELEGFSGPGNRGTGTNSFSCKAETVEVVSCVAPASVAAYEGMEVVIPVKVTAGAGSELTNEAKVEGGEGAPSAARAQTVKVASSPTPFGAERFELKPENEDGTPDTQAGSHPFQLTTVLGLNQTLEVNPTSHRQGGAAPALPRNLHFVLPPGLLGNVTVVPQCSNVDFSTITPKDVNLCKENTAVGVARITLREPNLLGVLTESVPVFNLEPAAGEPARFGLEIDKVPVVFNTAIRTGSDYAVEVSINNASQAAAVLGSEVTFWGVPGDPRHNNSRGWECLGDGHWAAGAEPEKRCERLNERIKPFLTLPATCAEASTSVSGVSWTGAQLPSTKYQLPQFGGCESLGFTPKLSVEPDTTAASTPAGLNVKINLPQESTLSVSGLAEADLSGTTLTLPQGMETSPAAANGLLTCSGGAFGFNGPEETASKQSQNNLFSTAAASCPDQSKIGTVRIQTPLLGHELTGGAYLASQNTNPFASPLVLYLFAEDPISGVRVKLAGEVRLDQSSGQLTSVFAGTPPVPFEELSVNLFGGSRASQSTPPLCGTYAANASFSPSSGAAPAQVSSSFPITSGPGGGPCPTNPLPFAPSLQAGSTSTQAGAFTSFTMALGHADSDQAINGLTVHLPAGVAAQLASVTPCPIAQADQAACGPESLIGHATTLSGLGGTPYQFGGSVYLTGPYNGAPFGISVLTPAKTPAFNLGNIVANSTIQVDQTTAAVTITTVESRILDPTGQTTIAASPLPTIVKGVPVQLKAIDVVVDREHFQFNPTNCGLTAVTGTLNGAEGRNASVSTPFQSTNCTSLPFTPVLTASTKSSFSKNNGAALSIKVTSAPGQANIAKTHLVIPKSLPSRLSTIQKACPDSAFSANPANCSAHYEGSLIGMAIVHTPVLKSPLIGPGYLVSHGGAAFPDVEFVLQGEGITLILDGQTFISNGVTTSTFNAVPDAPVSSFEAILPQGPHSALTAYLPGHGNLCGSNLLIPTTITGQNGVVIVQNTKVAVSGCGGVKSFKANRTQLLARALKACRKKPKGARASCERHARKLYGSAAKKTKRKR